MVGSSVIRSAVGAVDRELYDEPVQITSMEPAVVGCRSRAEGSTR